VRDANANVFLESLDADRVRREDPRPSRPCRSSRSIPTTSPRSASASRASARRTSRTTQTRAAFPRRSIGGARPALRCARSHASSCAWGPAGAGASSASIRSGRRCA
jgi:hypothetical protein